MTSTSAASVLKRATSDNMFELAVLRKQSDLTAQWERDARESTVDRPQRGKTCALET